MEKRKLGDEVGVCEPSVAYAKTWENDSGTLCNGRVSELGKFVKRLLVSLMLDQLEQD